VITGLVFAILRERTTKYGVLKWNSRDGEYTVIRIDVAGATRVY
jgi:hypothetical protein